MRGLALALLAACAFATPPQALEARMEQPAKKPCRFVEVEPDGALVLDVDGKPVRATLRGARIDPSKAARAGAFLAERSPRVSLRCTVRVQGSPAVVDVELLAWRDKSGEVWQNLGAVLIEKGLAESDV